MSHGEAWRAWNDPESAHLFAAFEDAHDRYRVANLRLAAHAALEPAAQVLDVASGVGGTAAAALRHLGDAGRITCVEPAAAMRATGRARLTDPRVTWSEAIPDDLRFDRALCGASLWLLGDLDETTTRLASRLRPGGALAFTIPALVLQVPDEPGDGRDPSLLELPARLAELVERVDRPRPAAPAEPLNPAHVDAALTAAGLRAERWAFQTRLTQSAYREWLRIPAVGLAGEGTPADRDRAMEEASANVDFASWRWERWLGWTAWRA